MSSAPKRSPLRIFLISGAVIVALCLAMALWHIRPVRHRFYTDADTIHRSVDVATTRDILWQPPTHLPDGVNSAGDDYEPCLSADGLTLFFVRGKAGENADLYTCTRTPDGWTEPQPLAAVNTESEDLGPEPSADGSALYFYSDRAGGFGGYDLWVSYRGAEGWQPALNLGPAVNSGFNDYGPALSPDGGSLYFASNRPHPNDVEQPDESAWPATVREDLFRRDYDLYVSRISEGGPTGAVPLSELNSPDNEGTPAVSPVGDFVYFSSDRPGGEGGFDLYRSRRLRGRHEPPTNLGPTVNTSAHELDPALGLGGYGLHFSSNRPVGFSGTEERHSAPKDYDLYYTTSREVFVDVDVQRASIDWGTLWMRIGPNLLWALLALLALLLLLALISSARSRKLSLLARCLLASTFAHLLLLLLFNFWEVTASLADAFRRGRGATRIALISPARGDDIVHQIRGGLSEIETPEFEPVRFDRQDTPLDIEPADATAIVAVERSQMRIEVEPDIVLTPRDADGTAPSTPEPDDQRLADATPVQLDPVTPADAIPVSRTEGDSPNLPEHTDTPTPDRPELFVAAIQGVHHDPKVILEPPSSTAANEEPTDSLAAWAPPRDAAPPEHRSESVSTVAVDAVSVASASSLAIKLPSDTAPRTNESVEVSPRVAVVQTQPPRRSLASPLVSRIVDGADQRINPEPTARDHSDKSFANAPETEPVETAFAFTSTTSADTPNTIATKLPTLSEMSLPAMEESTLDVARVESPPQPTERTIEPLRAGPIDHAAMESRSVPVEEFSPEETKYVEDARTLAVRLEPLDIRGKTPSDRSPDLPSSLASILARTPLHVAETSSLGLRLPTEVQPPSEQYEHRAPEQHAAIVKRMGGSSDTERAVAAALKWLAAHQSPDGRWDGEHFDDGCGRCGGETDIQADMALTGLSLLSFLGAGHTHIDDGPYRDVVRRGLDWLVTQQADDGDLRGEETMYSHGIATIAISEALGMTGDSRLTTPVRRAVRFIDRARNRRAGGWRYDPGQEGDTSVLGWQVMALKSARLAGIDVPDELFRVAAAWLDRVSDGSQSGLYAYRPGRRYTPTMTAEGMFVRQLLGHGRGEARMRGSAEYVTQHLPDWDDHLNTYFWYYATLAMFHTGGEQWTRWNDALTKQLVEHQAGDDDATADGSGFGPAGSWEPIGEWAPIGSRIYQTALCTLMLEVYYRYLPLYTFEESDAPAITFDEPGTIRGRVIDVATGDGLPGADIRLELVGRRPIVAESDHEGLYVLRLIEPDEVPDFFVLTATLDGYVPESINVSAELFRRATMVPDFNLSPERRDIVVVEDVPEVHHLGNDAFTGSINSRFQKDSEGTSFSSHFELTADQVRPRIDSAEVSMMAKGVQCPHEIRINGHTIDAALGMSPRDGRFGEFSAGFDPDFLRAGDNSIEITTVDCAGDIDDYEFVNLQIHLGIPAPGRSDSR